MTEAPDAARDRLVDRIVEHLNATPLPVFEARSMEHVAHGSHGYYGACAICRAGSMNNDREPLRVLVAEVLAFAEADAAPLVHAYEWFIDPRFDGLTVACHEPITQAGLRATAVRGDVTCPACLDRIRVSVQ